MNDQILETPNTMRILNPYRYGLSAYSYIISLGPTLYIDATAETSYADTDSVPIAHDWSGNGNNATQATPAYQPTFSSTGINGKPTFVFDGSNDMLSTTGIGVTQPNTFISVAAYDNSDTAARAILESGGTGRQFLRTNAGNWQVYAGSVVTLTADDANTHVFTASMDGASSNVYIDGVGSAISPGTNGIGNVYIGSGASIGLTVFSGKIVVMAIFNRLLTTQERYNVEDLLGIRSGVTITH